MDAGRRSLLGDCDWVGARFMYAQSYPVLGGKPILVCAHPIGPEPLAPAVVTRRGARGGERAAISAYVAAVICCDMTIRLHMHAGRSGSALHAFIGMHFSLPH